MAPCFIGDAGGATQLPQEAVRCFLLGCFVRFCSWCLLRFGPLSPGFAPSLPIPFGWSSAFWSSQCSAGPPGIWLYLQLYLLVNHCTFNCVSLASTRMRKLWYGVLWLIGSCLHSSSWQQSFGPVLCGALRSTPCWGAAQAPLALALRFSPLGDPEPLRTPLKLHAPCKILLLRASFPHLVRLPVPEEAEKLIFWAFRPGHTLDSQYMKCSMTLHVSLVSLRLPP